MCLVLYKMLRFKIKFWKNKIWCPVISTAVKQTRFMNGSIICGDETYWCPQISADIFSQSLKSLFMTMKKGPSFAVWGWVTHLSVTQQVNMNMRENKILVKLKIICQWIMVVGNLYHCENKTHNNIVTATEEVDIVVAIQE